MGSRSQRFCIRVKSNNHTLYETGCDEFPRPVSGTRVEMGDQIKRMADPGALELVDSLEIAERTTVESTFRALSHQVPDLLAFCLFRADPTVVSHVLERTDPTTDVWKAMRVAWDDPGLADRRAHFEEIVRGLSAPARATIG